MSALSPDFRRTALLEGTPAGKMPTPRVKKWGWWYLPVSAIALVGASYWGMQHIERQVESSAPSALEQQGIDSSNLAFEANYRHVTVTGTLPTEANPTQLEYILASFKGPNGESIRAADVKAVNPILVEAAAEKVLIAPTPIVDLPEVQVAAKVDGDFITLFGSVPAIHHEATLVSATQQAFGSDKIDNRITISNPENTSDTGDSYINNFAAVLSNLDRDVIDAEITLDNEKLRGRISTSNVDKQKRLQATIPDKSITVLVSKTHAEQHSLLEIKDQVTELQNELELLQDQIKRQIVFAPASTELQPSAYPVIEQIASAMQTHPEVLIEVGGHTDSASTAAKNIVLSERRAQAVVDQLVQNGIEYKRLIPIGFGESHPLFPNDTAENRAKNRRVEFRAHIDY